MIGRSSVGRKSGKVAPKGRPGALTSPILAVDVGGTFTDVVLLSPDLGTPFIEKVLSTPEAPELGVLQGIAGILKRTGLSLSDVGRLVHASTVATNALLEGKGARTGLLTTLGHRDTIEIGRELRYDLYDLEIRYPTPIVSRKYRREIPERILGDGTVLRPLDVEAVRREASRLIADGCESLAICFINSYKNPEHELQALKVIRALGAEVELSASADVSPQIREYERFVTTAINAYVKPVVRRYLSELQIRLRADGYLRRLFIMLSNGGISVSETAGEFPVKMLESGPAAGALAAEFHGTASGDGNIIGFDIGGTTAKISLVEDGQAQLTQEIEVARVHRFKRGSGYPLQTAAIELVEIGAGGGSIARKGAMGLLTVGPDSAGANPGPACYGQGGRDPTVTDAALILGYLDPTFFLGGKMELDRSASEKALGRLAIELSSDLIGVAAGVFDTINESMASAMRMHLAEKGKDPRRFTLFAFGGAGPVHAFEIARRLGIKRIVCPRGSGIAAACGALMARPAMNFVRSYQSLIDELDWQYARKLLSEMESEGVQLLLAAGESRKDIEVRWSCDLRYALQGYWLEVEIPRGQLSKSTGKKLVERFNQAHSRQYGRSYPDVKIEAVNWRVWVQGRKSSFDIWAPERTGKKAAKPTKKATRKIYLPEQHRFAAAAVYDREVLSPGLWLSGPAIVQERESTAVIGSKSRFCVDNRKNLVIELL